MPLLKKVALDHGRLNRSDTSLRAKYFPSPQIQCALPVLSGTNNYSTREPYTKFKWNRSLAERKCAI